MAYIANILHVSLRSIMKNKRRNIFTMIGIIIGIAAVITIMSLGNGFKKTADEQFSDAGASKDSALVSFLPNNFDTVKDRLLRLKILRLHVKSKGFKMRVLKKMIHSA